MLRLALVLSIAAVTGEARPPAKTVSFWLDVERFSAEESEAIVSTLERLANRRQLVDVAGRREQADLLLQLRAGAAAASASSGGAARRGTDTDPDDLAASDEGEVSSSNKTVTLSLLDIMRDEPLFEKEIRCRLPLVQSKRVIDLMREATCPKSWKRWKRGPRVMRR